jgi:hypothetical protein
MPSVILDLRRPETGYSMPFDLALPVQEFVDRQTIALAGVIEAQKATAHRGDDFRLSPDHPTVEIRRGKIRNSQRTAIGSDDVTGTGTMHPVIILLLAIEGSASLDRA